MYYEDILIIETLVMLEGLLSIDNALVIAVLVRHLKPPYRQRSLFYGIAGALALRLVALVSAVWIIQFWFLQGIGALYLAYISVAHFLQTSGPSRSGPPPAMAGFWKTVLLVELTDLAFAVDSVLVAVALSKKIWVIYTGVVIGMVAMRYAAGIFSRLLDRIPVLETVAYLLVGWISVKLFFSTYESFSAAVWERHFEHHLLPPWLFWGGTAAIVIGGLLYQYKADQKGRRVRE